MRKLYLLRHAKSEWDDPELDDFDRPLNKRGHRNAKRMAAYFEEQNIRPDLILCSAAKRATETCSYFQKNGQAVQFKEELYLASAQTLVNIVRQLDDSYESIMVVAHNPGLEDLTLQLGRNSDPDLRRQVGFKYPTASVADLEIESQSWSDVSDSNARLINFVRPKDLPEEESVDNID